MIRVGITGGIGSGKSTVCSVFELLGVPVYYADAEAKLILNENEEVKANVIAAFGVEILNTFGAIDRKKLAKISFSDKAKLELLNKIIHPAVGKHFEDWCGKHKNEKYILKEAAILFESGAFKHVEKIIAVTAPLELKRLRVMLRDGISEEEFEKRRVNQWADEEKVKRSDFVVRNDEMDLVIPQVIDIDRVLKGV